MEPKAFAVIDSVEKAMVQTPELRAMARIDLIHAKDPYSTVMKELKKKELTTSFLKFLENSVTEKVIARTNSAVLGYRLGDWIRNHYSRNKFEGIIGRRVENHGYCFLEARGEDLEPVLYIWKPNVSFDTGFNVLALRDSADWYRATPEEVISLWNALLIVRGVMFGDE